MTRRRHQAQAIRSRRRTMQPPVAPRRGWRIALPIKPLALTAVVALGIGAVLRLLVGR